MQLAELEALVAGIRNTIDNIWTSIQNAHTVNDNQRELIQGLHDAIDKIKDVNNGQKDALADLYKKVKVLQNVVALGEGGNATQAELDAAIAAVEAALAVLEGDVADNAADIASINMLLGDAFAQIGLVSSTLDSYKDEVDELIAIALAEAKEYSDNNDTSLKSIGFGQREDGSYRMTLYFNNGNSVELDLPQFFVNILNEISDEGEGCF